MNVKPYCVLCKEQALTTAAHIPVCERHYEEYKREARQYLPEGKRKFYQRLLRANTEHGTQTTMLRGEDR
jgi:hypothetical protein